MDNFKVIIVEDVKLEEEDVLLFIKQEMLK